MIPKIIHYVWVGNQEKSELILKCIESWKKMLPDYEIIEWNNEKFFSIKNKYSEEAFNNKKWAFVSDYIRLYALYNYGGIYLDTDVEITEKLDKFLGHDFFSGHENYHGKYSPITALMGSQKKNSIIKDLLDHYSNESFETKKGLNMQSNTSRISNYFVEKFKISRSFDGRAQIILQENSVIYPSAYFCTPEDNSENYAIHHFNGSWVDGFSRRNKLIFFNKYIIARFKKNERTKSSVLPILHNEKLLFCIKVSKRKSFGLIEKL